MDEFAATMLVVAGGVVLNTCLGLGAIYAAVVLKIRVWVHPRLRSMTGGDLRGVVDLKPTRRGFNYAIFVVATAVVFPILAASTFVVAVLTVGKNRNQLETTPFMILAWMTFIILPIAMIPCYVWLSSRIIARCPRESWPEMKMEVVDRHNL